MATITNTVDSNKVITCGLDLQRENISKLNLITRIFYQIKWAIFGEGTATERAECNATRNFCLLVEQLQKHTSDDIDVDPLYKAYQTRISYFTQEERQNYVKMNAFSKIVNDTFKNFTITNGLATKNAMGTSKVCETSTTSLENSMNDFVFRKLEKESNTLKKSILSKIDTILSKLHYQGEAYTLLAKIKSDTCSVAKTCDYTTLQSNRETARKVAQECTNSLASFQASCRSDVAQTLDQVENELRKFKELYDSYAPISP